MNNGTFISNNNSNPKNTDRPGKSIETISVERSNSLLFLLSFVAKYFAFYGMQWLLCVKLNAQPFSLIESIVIYLGLLSIFIKHIK